MAPSPSLTTTDTPVLRRAYDAVDRNLSPRVEALVHSNEFTHLAAVIARIRHLALSQVNVVTARFWHQMNLPAGSDVQRLRAQVGALDREVRRLTLQLDRNTE